MIVEIICFYGQITIIIPKLSSNTLLICSTDHVNLNPACSVTELASFGTSAIATEDIKSLLVFKASKQVPDSSSGRVSA